MALDFIGIPATLEIQTHMADVVVVVSAHILHQDCRVNPCFCGKIYSDFP